MVGLCFSYFIRDDANHFHSYVKSTFYFCINPTVLQDSSTDEFWWPLPEQNIEFSCPVIQYEWWLFILIYNLFGVGSYVVQSLTIKWKAKNSSHLGVKTESRSTIAELIKPTLDVLYHQLHHAIKIVLKI